MTGHQMARMMSEASKPSFVATRSFSLTIAWYSMGSSLVGHFGASKLVASALGSSGVSVVS